MKNILFSTAVAALVGACAPYPPNPAPPAPPAPPTADAPPTLTDEEQRQLQENRDRLDRERRQREREARNDRPTTRTDTKPKYPTAAAVPGKPGFVFNPYTHNIVDVKGIGSGKLVRDPEDNDPTHKFRVP